MPTTRKKVIKTVYKDDDDSEAEKYEGDFSDSGSEAQISEQSSSEDVNDSDLSSADEFDEKPKKTLKIEKLIPKLKPPIKRRPKFAKQFVSKIHKQELTGDENVDEATPAPFSVKDLTDADKLLPAALNLSESDSSEDESPKPVNKQKPPVSCSPWEQDTESDENESKMEYRDVWSQNLDNSEEVAKKMYMELEQQTAKLEETKASILNYTASTSNRPVSHNKDFDVKDLLAQGEELVQRTPEKKKKSRKPKDDSDSEMEDWEEVHEAKVSSIPQQGLQLVVAIPDAVCRRTKKLDIEMMMKRKMNRVKKETQAYMHKIHVLCWLGHGNYVSRVLNDQDILAAALSLVPSKECYPGERVDLKYVEQITTWYKDKMILKQDKNEDKFKPKAPPLKEILLSQIKTTVVTTKKYLVFIFASMLRALGLQCRVMFNFVTLPIRPPSSELCSLSTKPKDDKSKKKNEEEPKKIASSAKGKSKNKIPQVDGNFDDSDSEMENILQLDGNDDTVNSRTMRSRGKKNVKDNQATEENHDVSPPKRARKNLSTNAKSTKTTKQVKVENTKVNTTTKEKEEFSRPIRARKSPSSDPTRLTNKQVTNAKADIITEENEDVSQPKRPRKSVSPSAKTTKTANKKNEGGEKLEEKDIVQQKSSTKTVTKGNKKDTVGKPISKSSESLQTKFGEEKSLTSVSPRKTRNARKNIEETDKTKPKKVVIEEKNCNAPEIIITNEDKISSKYFGSDSPAPSKKLSLNRRRSKSTTSTSSQKPETSDDMKNKSRTRSAPRSSTEKSKYFDDDKNIPKGTKKPTIKNKVQTKKEFIESEDSQRVSHRDLVAKNKRKPNNDVKDDLIGIMKSRVKEAFEKSKRGKVKGKVKEEYDGDSDYLPVESPKQGESDDDFKPTKISPKPSTSKTRKIDRRVLSSDDDSHKDKTDVWCEVFVEELEQWISVDVVKGKVHCTKEIYKNATHPVCYIVGWDNNNYLKDLTRRYVPQWNTVTRKQRVDPAWWETAIRPWLGPKTARDREEDEQLNTMQLEAPLPTSIAEYKNHPLYALKRHLLKFEAIYPPDAPALGFVRKEPVYARECVYVCRSREIWLKEAKVVRLGEEPYKIVKARPKWDKLSNKLITDKPLEIFGPWQVQDYEPPVAENGIVPRNEYGNVELFKQCMLPKGTVQLKLPGLARVAKKLNIDCAPAMTGFSYEGGWAHPVFDGVVVCKEFEEILTDAWVKDQEEQERREREKIENRVYGNWRRLIKGLFIRERLKHKYGFEEPTSSTSQEKKKGPRLVVKKK